MMKQSICILAAAVGLFLAAGCSSMVKDVTSATGEKNVNASGYLVYGKLTTALDPVTGTPAPSGTWLTGNLNYKSTVVSIPNGHSVPDSGDYERTESASIFNSDAKTTTVKFSFTASSKEAADKTLQQLVEFDKQQKEKGEKGEVMP